jgi:outer membrane lipoprotein LolB
MSLARPGLRAWAVAGLLAALAGCATPVRAPATANAAAGPWAGRLALQVPDQPSQSFSAGFELRGSPGDGELDLYSPIGSTLAVLTWQPGRATLRASGKTTEYESVDALVAQVTGSPIPVKALFDWLRGVDVPVPGWQADLSQLGQGRLAARRLDPPPQADLRVVLER